MFHNTFEIIFDHTFLNKNSDLLILSKPSSKKKDAEAEKDEADSLIYYSSVNENTDTNYENDLEYQKLWDDTTIFRQIQNYTKNLLIKKTFDSLNHSLK